MINIVDDIGKRTCYCCKNNADMSIEFSSGDEVAGRTFVTPIFICSKCISELRDSISRRQGVVFEKEYDTGITMDFDEYSFWVARMLQANVSYGYTIISFETVSPTKLNIYEGKLSLKLEYKSVEECRAKLEQQVKENEYLKMKNKVLMNMLKKKIGADSV